MKKYLCILPIIFVFGACVFILIPVIDESIIAGLIDIKERLGERYIAGLNFDFADDDEQVLSGYEEKYILKDNRGSRWLFKPASGAKEISTFFAYRLADILGVDTPVMRKFSVSINGMERPGFIQEFIPVQGRTFLFASILERNDPDLISNALVNEIFGWLVCFYYFDIELLITSKKKIYQIDLSDAFYHDKEKVLAGKTENYPQDFFYMRDKKIKFGKALRLLRYIDGLDEGWLRRQLEASVVRCSAAQAEARDVYELLDYKNSALDLLMERKHSVIKEFRKKFFLHPDFNNKVLALSHEALLYKLGVCNKLCFEIFRLCLQPGLFGKKIDIKRPSELSCVYSKKAWDYIVSNFEDTLSERGDFKIPEANIIFSNLENGLLQIRRDSNGPKEKLAVTIYIRQLRTLKGYVNAYNESPKNLSNVFVPVVLNAKNFIFPDAVDSWYRRQRYQTKGRVPVVGKNGEEEYMKGLIEMVNKRSGASKKFMGEAKNKGYATDEAECMITAGSTAIYN